MKSNNCMLMLIVLSVLVSACYPAGQAIQPTPTRPSVPVDLTDRSWLTDQPCKAPCWYGMLVGETTLPEALESIRTIGFLRPEPVREYSFGYLEKNSHDLTPGGKGLVFACVQPEGWECVYLDFVNEVLFKIEVLLTFEIRFGDVVKAIGPPNYIHTSIYGGPEKTTGCAIEMIWLERQLSVRTTEWNEYSGRDLCKLYVYQNNRKPFSNLIATHIKVMATEDIDKLDKDQWSGFVDP